MFFYFLLQVLGRSCGEMRLGLRFKPKVVWTFLHILGKKNHRAVGLAGMNFLKKM